MWYDSTEAYCDFRKTFCDMSKVEMNDEFHPLSMAKILDHFLREIVMYLGFEIKV